MSKRNCHNCGAEIEGHVYPYPEYGMPFQEGERCYCTKPECQQAGHDYIEECERAERAKRALNMSFVVKELHIPNKYASATIDDRGAPTAKALTDWCLNPLGGLAFVTGPVGVGKTHILYAVKKLCYVHQIPCWIEDLPELATKWSAMKPWEAMQSARAILRFPGVVLLDDLGAERDDSLKEDSRITDMLNAIISEREKWQRRTLVTSNLSLDAIATRYGPRTSSRLDGGKVVKFTGKDRRLM